MSTIPPNWLGSIIQTQGAHERTGQARATDEANNANRGAFSERLQDVIENSDRDGEVYSDAEGAGSEGTPFSDAEEEAEQEQSAEDENENDSGLDIEA